MWRIWGAVRRACVLRRRSGLEREGRRTGLSETDWSLQRADIKLGKHHYGKLNKVASVRYRMQPVCFCCTWCNAGSCNFTRLLHQAGEEAPLAGWIPKWMTGPGGWATWRGAAGPGVWICPAVWLITSRRPPPVCCCCVRGTLGDLLLSWLYKSRKQQPPPSDPATFITGRC